MSTYKSWMYRRLNPDGFYLTDEFANGLVDFINFATSQPTCMDGTKIRCPCRDCKNLKFFEPQEVEYHLKRKGFLKNYFCWTSHEETYTTEIYGNQKYADEIVFGPGAQEEEDDEAGPSTIDPYQTMVMDAYGHNFEYPTYEPENPNPQAQAFYDTMKTSEVPLFDGCDVTLLGGVSRLMSLKSQYNLPEACYDEFCNLINDINPDSCLPDTFYETKKFVHNLGLPVEKIDACKRGCMIFWGDDIHCKKCKFCDHERFDSENKGAPHSVMWYFPLKDRLQRLYASEATAKHMRWHAEHTKDPETMTHPSDAEAWRHFDDTYPEFAHESRNIRLGLCTDGFMPFGQYGKQYSSWPVIITPYNLPPGMCMKEEFMFLTAIVPGPNDPKQKIDIFLQPLIAELIQLWDVGVQTYDSSRKQNFTLRAALMWTIGDFPAYSMLSGWPTSGRLACPYCRAYTDAFTLRNGGKQSWFDNHRKFLPMRHRFRQDVNHFTRGKVVTEKAPPLETGAQILQWIDDLELMRVTELDSDETNERKHNQSDCGWKKRSIFWDLPYWITNLIRHNLDVMHIEKNCFENVFNTVMDVKGKTKDNDKSRKDLAIICNRPELDLDENGVYPEAKYIIKKNGVRALCEWLRKLKFPDGYVSNMSRCVEKNIYRASGMKSHDCHVFMQRLIPIAFRELLPEPVWEALTEFSLFFKELTCNTLRVEDMIRLEKEIPIILCKLEQIFPPSFFDSMEHLPVHLAYEAKIAGPVQYRWMYPFERYLKHLKKTVRNKARVEGSIGNAYVADEFSNFGSLYFEPHVHTRRRKVRRNDDGGERVVIPGNLSIFTHPGRATSKGIERTLSHEEYKAARSYILQNCKEIEQYVPIFIKYLQDNSLAYTNEEISAKVDDEFPEWFENYAKTPSNIQDNEFIYSLALGPLRRAKSYAVYFVNGYKFHTLKYGREKITSNCGVCIKGFTDFSDKSSSNDYYGILTDILELEFPRQPIKKTVLFKCHWFDPSRKGKKVHRRYNLVDVNIKSNYPKYDPFILAMQAMQVCYIPYPRLSIKENNEMGVRKKKTSKGDKDWWAVCKVKARPIIVQQPSVESEETEAFQDDERIGHRITNAEFIDPGPLNATDPEPGYQINIAEDEEELILLASSSDSSDDDE